MALEPESSLQFSPCVFEFDVYHERVYPKKHRFKNHLYMFYLDVDALEQSLSQPESVLENIPKSLLGVNTKTSRYGYFLKDHMPFDGTSNRAFLNGFLAQNGIETPPATIFLLTHCRFQGFVFNPISIYFCFDANHQPVCAIAEVSNTFLETKPYFLEYDPVEQVFKADCDKLFYISPFSRPDTRFRFKMALPRDGFFLHIEEYKLQEYELQEYKEAKEQPLVYAGMHGKPMPLDETTLLDLEKKHPRVTRMVRWMIHWHAFLLFLKGLRFYFKEENAHLQQGLLNPRSVLFKF
jgi:DUF1365 family protein